MAAPFTVIEDGPVATKSMQMALSDLKLERPFVVDPGDAAYPMQERIEALPLSEVLRIVEISGGAAKEGVF